MHSCVMILESSYTVIRSPPNAISLQANTEVQLYNVADKITYCNEARYRMVSV